MQIIHKGNNTLDISLKREFDKPFILKINANVGGYPCLDLKLTPNKDEFYPLLKVDPIGCGEFGDMEKFAGLMDNLISER